MIRDAPVAEKDADEMVNDIQALATNIISFPEMREQAGYQIPAQGSPGNIAQSEKLYPLIQDRISTDIDTDDSERDSVDSGTTLRSRSGANSLQSHSYSDTEVSYNLSVPEQISRHVEHEEVLDTFETRLEELGLDGGETSQSDLIAASNEEILLAEAKSIHSKNEARQIRTALGQLLEYRHRDILTDETFSSLDLTMCLVLSRPPSEQHQQVLRSAMDANIHTFWITDDGAVDGLPVSMSKLADIAE